MRPLRICIIGAGEWATAMHLPAMRKLAGAGQVLYPAVCDLNKELADRYAVSLGAEGAFTEVPRMLDACRPDGVVVLVPPAETPGLLFLLIERGVGFLTEKPPATDTPTHRRLCDAVGGLTHLVGYNRRHAPYLTRARQWLSGARLQSVTAMFSRHRRHDPDFSTTAVHAIDTARCLAGDDLAALRIEVAPAGEVSNYFLSGWTRRGTRVDILVTPDTASGQEHYIVRSADRTAVIAFPHRSTVDLPGHVELHEGNRILERLGPGDFGLSPDDAPALAGILGEHELFCRALRGQATVESTLASTLGTQQIRDELSRLVALGGRQEAHIDFPETPYNSPPP